jgi:hypothetical protein
MKLLAIIGVLVGLVPGIALADAKAGEAETFFATCATTPDYTTGPPHCYRPSLRLTSCFSCRRSRTSAEQAATCRPTSGSGTTT